ncbi:hypothetical protein GCM10010988_17530 [Cnuibacter physcomitrellae]|uniref:hypothetical protein n=1 Tax=Cnuibacter physcomitrellae TaxID=1619308 RepID=UPI0012F4DEB7|nr:hypothetical protein [Cnuibacter physcomitrellae]GGI38145.1 hypothetical protein GCM10010988_17530 [Cnuibacter physcomitrellae]
MDAGGATVGYFVNVPAFLPDSRGAKLQRFEVFPPRDGRQGQILALCTSSEVASQVARAAGSACQEIAVSEEKSLEWTHAFYFPDGIPAGLDDFLDLLSTCLTLNQRAEVDLSMALDWYKRPDAELNLVVSDAGRWINYTKHAPYPNGTGSQKARAQMHDALVDFVARHPEYSVTEVLTAPPGHKADGKSYAETIAKALAKATGKRYVAMTAPGPRAEQKEEGLRELTDVFTLEEVVSGRVLIFDDVFHTGATLDAAARAVRAAGGTEVLTLNVARAMRN